MNLPRTLALSLLSIGLLALPTGCAAVGVLASAMPKPNIKPAYEGLKGQSVAVMVWADRGLRIDWNTIREDLASGVQKRLTEAVNAKSNDLAGTTFPLSPESVVKYQRDYPSIEAEPITAIAPRFHVTRLIYIELNNLTTRTAQSIVMYRGNATASLKVIEISNGKATVVYEEPSIQVSYPPKSPEDGRLDGNDGAYYAGTIQTLADTIALKFIEHPQE
ncbi:MAG: hypothetical protein QM770_00475 [Tepidisphaeraceae bacterium]